MLATSLNTQEASSQPRIRHPLVDYMDGILRQREEFLTDVFENREVGAHITRLLVIIGLLSEFYGLIMGSFNGWKFMLSSCVKVPLLYLFTLAICFPLLHVVNVLMGSRLRLLQTMALILVALAINCILLGVCAPIVLFFQITGASYEFIKLLHVGVFTFGGLWGMVALWRALVIMCEKSDLYPRTALRILQVWILIFGFVGTQMAWSLRPYIGNEGSQWQLLRTQESNFYVNVGATVKRLFSGD